MGLFSRSSNSSNSNSDSSSTETRRPVLDPDSDACVWATAAERADDTVIDRMLAEARDQRS